MRPVSKKLIHWIAGVCMIAFLLPLVSVDLDGSGSYYFFSIPRENFFSVLPDDFPFVLSGLEIAVGKSFETEDDYGRDTTESMNNCSFALQALLMAVISWAVLFSKSELSLLICSFFSAFGLIMMILLLRKLNTDIGDIELLKMKYLLPFWISFVAFIGVTVLAVVKSASSSK